MTPIGPCLRFYVQHADEVDSLLVLKRAGKLQPSDDLALFDEVHERTRLDALFLLERLFRPAVEIIKAHGLFDEKARRSDIGNRRAEYWSAYQYLTQNGSSTEAFLNVRMWSSNRQVFLLAGVSAGSKAMAGLRNLLVEWGVALAERPAGTSEGEWDNALRLAVLPLRADTTVEDLEAGCRKAFEALGSHLRAVVDLAANAGK